MKPLLLIVSAPSGAGKTTLCDMLLQAYPEFEYSVSCTTREPRYTEEDGVDYHFLSAARFKELLKKDSFLEHAEVHGNYYGTLKEPVEAALKQGQCVLLDIDVEGAAQVRKAVSAMPSDSAMRQGYVDIFINPPSLDVLRERLEGRGTDSQEVIEKRLENAKREMERSSEYMYRETNDDLRICFKRLCDIINVKGEFV
jgi:guanylate kinase